MSGKAAVAHVTRSPFIPCTLTVLSFVGLYLFTHDCHPADEVGG